MADVRPDDFAVVIQTIKGRADALLDTQQSLVESDVGDRYDTVVGEFGHMQQTFVASLRRLQESGKRYGIRLEDDVLVSRYLLENVASWSALERDDFGVGWLFHSGAFAANPTNVVALEDGMRRTVPEMVGSLGVVLRVDMIDEVIAHVLENWDAVEGQQDRALARAIASLGKSLYIHAPPLVEHNVKHVSTLAPDRAVDTALHTTGGHFNPHWRRQGLAQVAARLPKPTGTILDYQAGKYGDAFTSHKGRPAEHPFGVRIRSPWENADKDGFSGHGVRLVHALGATKLPLQLLSPSPKFYMRNPHAERDLQTELKPYLEASIGTYCAFIEHTVPSGGILNRLVVAPHHRRVATPQEIATFNSVRVLSTVWERHTGIPAQDVEALNAVAQCWVTCEHTEKVLTNAGVAPSQFRRVPVPFFPDDPHLELRYRRRRPGPPKFYAIGKWEPRKEHRNLLLAFMRAFSPGEAVLMLKTSPRAPKLKGYPQSPWEAVHEVLEDADVRQNGWTLEKANKDLVIIDSYITDKRMLKLHEMCDVYCTIGRGEGFDMPAFDARLAGNLLVYTPSGGPQSFAGPDDLLVPETGQVPCNDFYKWHGSTYLDYDVDDVVKQLQAAAELTLPSPRRSIGTAADLELLDPWRAETVGANMRRYLGELPGWPM